MEQQDLYRRSAKLEFRSCLQTWQASTCLRDHLRISEPGILRGGLCCDVLKPQEIFGFMTFLPWNFLLLS